MSLTGGQKLWVKRILIWLVAYLLIAYFLMGIGPSDAILHFGSNFAAMRQILVTAIVLMSFMVIQFAAMFAFLGRGASYTIFPGEYETTFDDIRGQPHAVSSTKEVLRLFQGLKDFKDEMGGEPPHGILFEGPPGTGKTSLGKAVAGETGVPFIYANGSGFANMFMGMSQFRVRGMFKKARKYAEKYGGCVVFIDELDAAGGSRGAVSERMVTEKIGSYEQTEVNKIIMGGMGMGGGGIINELLVQMDGLVTPKGLLRHIRRFFGIKKREVPFYNLLIIGATNRAQTLDPALLRPGRFDRKIHVGNPDTDGRQDIAQYYLAKVRHHPVDTMKLAKATRGYSPAQIKNLVNEALILALQGGRNALGWSDLYAAKIADEVGLKQPVTYTPKEKEMVAVHEGSHAVLARLLNKDTREVQIITIIKREDALGLVSSQDIEDTYMLTKEQIEADIMVSLAGLVGEEEFFGTSTSGPSSDLRAATIRAAQYVGMFGMGSKLTSVGALEEMGKNPIALVLGDKDRAEEVETLLQTLKAKTRSNIQSNKAAVEGVRDRLVEHEEMIGDEVDDLWVELGI
jgi:cell division protease FtsH